MEVSADRLEQIAYESGEPITLPTNSGWARVTVEGVTYRAWRNAVSEATA